MHQRGKITVLFFACFVVPGFWSHNVQHDDDDNAFQGIRIDCHPDSGASQTNCEQRGCIWAPTPEVGAPFCTFRNDAATMPGYDVVKLQRQPRYISAKLQREPRYILAKLQRRRSTSLFQGDVQELLLRIDMLSAEHLRIRLTDIEESKFEVPEVHEDMNRYLKRKAQDFSETGLSDELQYEVDVQQSPFGVMVKRKTSGAVLFDTKNIPGLTFALQFLQISTRLPSKNLYGLGENNHKQLRHDFTWRKWSFYNRDYPIMDNSQNEYGYHPFYLCLESDGNAHGVLFANSHAMDVMLQPDPIITFRTIGGIIDFHLFIGPKPDHVIQQYTNLIGRPIMPPYWGLGFQLSRYGLRNTSELLVLYDRNRAAKIPQDVQYLDIDYMNQSLDFTYSAERFHELPSFVERLTNENRHLVVIIDPGIASHPPVSSYGPLNRGLELDVFIKDPRSMAPIEGRVWPGNSFYPDFFKPSAKRFWKEMFEDFHKELNFSGIWIDMNEPSNFVDGSLTSCDQNPLNNPPYNPLSYPNMAGQTICADAQQLPGNHYALHNLYGYTESIATFGALRHLMPGQRPFVLSRSSFYGSGKYAAHWTGDNRSWWRQLKWSIVTCLEFNLFGIPWVGADICGFGDNATEEMCVRWHQLGAFYPFSRNHNDMDLRDQDPAAWSPKAIDAIRSALKGRLLDGGLIAAIRLRYQYLPYLYTLFHHAHTNGSTVMRPLFFEFPADLNCSAIDDQFLWGSDVMIAPILLLGQTTRSVYFPKGRWYNIKTCAEVPQSSENRNLTVPAPLDEVPVYTRGGSIIPLQSAKETTATSRQGHFVLQISLDENSHAFGQLFWDDGVLQNSFRQRRYFMLSFEANAGGNVGTITVRQLHNGLAAIDPSRQGIAAVQIAGIAYKPSNVQVLGYEPVPEDFVSFDAQIGLAQITFPGPIPLNSPNMTTMVIQWNGRNLRKRLQKRKHII